MWEAIRTNRRRSTLLVVLMALLLVGLGSVAAGAFAGPDAAWAGGFLALGIWGILYTLAVFRGDSLALMAARARRLEKEDAPQLWNVTEEMTIAAGLGTMPHLYLIDDDAPNAFATASRKGPAAVAVTAGLLRRLNRDELQGVVAHEIGHIRNRDVQFMTLALVMVGSIALVADMALRIFWFGGGRRRGSSKGNGQAQMVMLAITMLAAILAPLFARLLYFAVSRQREYLADASAARFTRYPMGLASALEKIAGSQTGRRGREMRAMAPLYIVNPLSRSATGLFSSHPPLDRRVAVLRAMGGGAGWLDYEKAFHQVVGDRTPCLDPKTLGSEGAVAARPPSAASEPGEEAVKRAREVTDLIDRLAQFLLISCACGVNIKVPPDFPSHEVACPRCSRNHPLPAAQEGTGPDEVAATLLAAAGAGELTPSPAASGRQATYQRQATGWESFRCPCGQVRQLSPSFSASQLNCKGCRRRIRILPADTA